MGKVNTTESIEKVENQPEVKETAAVETADKNLVKVAQSTGNYLNKQKKVTIKIPVDPQNPKDLIVSVGINGYKWRIKRGEKVEVPADVARILEESKYI